ncbi:hypothetical protein NQ176_g8975 [Zarea fungicola]|uniref:Uncharacterized protein n=1 Tax=Zarea fungicola TaxID=93591 RepID=A0ACC1MPG2_9HYPO|nr:hypothetical protein NQ176_g8975 [Lecanicillium fungicola]
MYQSKVAFTFDVVCPWTYVAKKRLDEALKQVRASDRGQKINFTLHFEPFRLSTDLPEAADESDWQQGSNTEAQRILNKEMPDLSAPINAGGKANTLHAHRIIQHFQDPENGGTEARTTKLVDALYARYFTRGQHPTAVETLVGACVEAGIDEADARNAVGDKELGLRKVRDRMRLVGSDVDAVPVVRIEGKKRDLTLTGAKEVGAYIKALETVAKDSS